MQAQLTESLPMSLNLISNPYSLSLEVRPITCTPTQRRSPGERNNNPLQYSCLETPMDRRAWLATVHGVARVRHNLATEQR